MAIPVGSAAPDFSLKTQTPEGLKTVTLSEHRGKQNVVLVFFPAAFSSICTDELCSITDTLNAYSQLNASVYGISVDSPFALTAFAAKEGIGFPLLTDFARTTVVAYDVELKDFAGTGGSASQRAAFVVDKEGVVRYSEQTPTTRDLPDFAAVRAALAGLG